MNIEAQLELEKGMVAQGVEAYHRGKDAALDGGRAHETGFAKRLIDEYIFNLADILDTELSRTGPGRHGKAKGHLRMVDPAKAVFIVLRNIFAAFATKKISPQTIASTTGTMIEDEIRFSRFAGKYTKYYQEIMDDFKKKGTKNYRYMHRVLTHSANNNEDGWDAWSIAERVDVGMRLISLVLEHTDLITKEVHFNNGKHVVTIEPTEQALTFINSYDEAASLLHPRPLPCIIPPDDWTALDQGGYYSPQLRARTKLVLTNNRKHRDILKRTDLSLFMSAVNGAQQVPWRVNSRVLSVAKEVWVKNLQVGMPSNSKLEPTTCPVSDIPKDQMNEEQKAAFQEWKRYASGVYTAEKERMSAGFQVASIMRAANDYSKYEQFWYVWTADFRGRLYTTTVAFSPQGPDLGKGMIMFANGKALGEQGVYWLKVHGANKFGYDKEDNDERVRWIDERQEMFLATANDPIGNMNVWSEADKPYQFLAFIFEYADMINGRLVGRKPEEFVSHLPVGLDGSCNGLQHFSAMLRDERGGKATNLTPSEKPSDIYSEVGEVCLVKVKADASDVMKEWASFALEYGKGKLPRKIPKRPVMTMPYGSTRQSCTTYIFEAVQEIAKTHFSSMSAFQASSALTPLLWKSIGEVVVAARLGMEWLQKCAGVMSKQGLGITWRTKDGFIVHMFEREIATTRIDTVLAGRYTVKVGDYSDVLDKKAQRNGVAPNFVHSQDSAHLRATILRAREYGITDLALIHDDYGTHAANTHILHKVIRDCFVEQYTEFDPLESFKNWCEQISKKEMPPMPEKGTLDIELVRQSKYFFG